MITSEDILERIKYGERISLECKEGKGEVPRSV